MIISALKEKEEKKIKLELIKAEQWNKMLISKLIPLNENRPEYDNKFYDSKVERMKDRKGFWGEYVTDKITN